MNLKPPISSNPPSLGDFHGAGRGAMRRGLGFMIHFQSYPVVSARSDSHRFCMYWAGRVGCDQLYTTLCGKKIRESLVVKSNRIVTPNRLMPTKTSFWRFVVKWLKMPKQQCVQVWNQNQSNLLLRVCSATHCSWFHGETFSETSATLWYY